MSSNSDAEIGRASVPWLFGFLTIVAEGDAVTAIHFDSEPTQEPQSHYAEVAAQQLRAYLAHELKEFTLRLHPQGTAFDHRVWGELVKVPFGHTTTYGDLATKLGLSKGASRAVGGANGRNPIPIVIPCHRVIGVCGLTGFAGGIEAKAWLLAHEGLALF